MARECKKHNWQFSVNSSWCPNCEIDRLRIENDKLKKGIKAVKELIEESRGVDGLHMNGDVAMWSELLQSGFAEDWLIDFSLALEL